MHSSGSALTQLPRGECLRLMGSVAIGRIVYTRQALPAVELVNFALDHGEIVVKTDGGRQKSAAATRNAVVAFEADEPYSLANTSAGVSLSWGFPRR